MSAGALDVTVNTDEVIAPVSPYIINGFNVNNRTQIIKVKKFTDKLKVSTIKCDTFEADADEVSLRKDLDFWKNQQAFINNPFTFTHLRILPSRNPNVTIKPEEIPPQLMAYAKSIGIRSDVWAIGHSPDLYARDTGDDSWTFKKYIATFKSMAKIIKGTDPNAKLAGPDISTPHTATMATFIKECGDQIDYLMWNWYPGKTNKLAVSRVMNLGKTAHSVINKYRELLKSPKYNPKGYNRDIKLVIGEWALDAENNNLLLDMPGVIFAMNALGDFAKAKLDYAHYFCLNGCGNNSLFNALGKPRLMNFFFSMVAEYFGNELLASKASHKDIDSVATKLGSSEYSVFVANKNPKAKRPVTITFAGMDSISLSWAYYLDDKTREVTEIKSSAMKISKNTVTLTLPPYSVAVVKVK
ncbi:MAG: hypothetical protein JW969_21175 [Spirochaetales bacterium]|nr:hypothetical protein [Spirochaetales bacterium]